MGRRDDLMCVCVSVRKPWELTTTVGSVHGLDPLVTPGDQDLNKSMLVCSNALGKRMRRHVLVSLAQAVGRLSPKGC